MGDFGRSNRVKRAAILDSKAAIKSIFRTLDHLFLAAQNQAHAVTNVELLRSNTNSGDLTKGKVATYPPNLTATCFSKIFTTGWFWNHQSIPRMIGKFRPFITLNLVKKPYSSFEILIFSLVVKDSPLVPLARMTQHLLPE